VLSFRRPSLYFVWITTRMEYSEGRLNDTPYRAPMSRHELSEINFWVPLTRVWGANSLQAESQPGRGDFHPFEMDYGEYSCPILLAFISTCME
jgi:hypothetical protein